MKLKHCLTLISQQLGFDNWHHAQAVLSGDKTALETLGMGSFLYPDSAGVFINEWFVDHQQARSQLIKNTRKKWLLPYKKQFIVVEKEFIDTLNIDEKYQHLWAEINNDMVESYLSVAWDNLVCQVIKNRNKGY